MSQMSTAPALKCSQCGDFYVLEHLSTTFPDPEAKLLHQLMRDFGNNGMCPNCIERKNYAERMRSSGQKVDLILRPGIRDQYAINLVSFMGGRRG
jgi:hypothetical protein